MGLFVFLGEGCLINTGELNFLGEYPELVDFRKGLLSNFVSNIKRISMYFIEKFRNLITVILGKNHSCYSSTKFG